jgi:hypothetical protein
MDIVISFSVSIFTDLQNFSPFDLEWLKPISTELNLLNKNSTALC